MLPKLKTPVPGPRSQELMRELRRYESRNVTFSSPGFPIFWERAHGVNVWDVDGNRFLDLTSAFSVSGLGFTPEAMVRAIQDQAPRLYHAMGDVHPSAEKVVLCRELSRVTFEAWGAGVGQVLLTNSGGEAVEAALKTALLATGKRGVIAFRGSYHGLGYGALAVTGRDDFQGPFRPQLADFATLLPYPFCQHCPFRPGPGCAAAECPEACAVVWEKEARAALETGKIGAILTEPLLGRGGDVVPPDWFLPKLRVLADEFGAILIFDEIYTGFYRTGRRFGCDHWGVVPDLVCLGKALTGGFPLAACVGKQKVMEAWPASDGEALHTSTFLGNPLGCRMAVTALQQWERSDWAGEVSRLGKHLFSGLQHLGATEAPWGSVRGKGLMAGIEVVTAEGKPDGARAGRCVEAMLGEGILILSGGVNRNVLSFSPPFVITPEEIDYALSALARISRF